MKRIDASRLAQLPPEQRKDYQERLEKLVSYRRENPLYFYNHPTLSTKPVHTKQIAFHALNARTRAFFGGNQSGKTTAGIADDLIQAVDEGILPSHLVRYKKWYAPFKCRIFTPDLSDTMFVLQDKIRELVPNFELVGGTWDQAYEKMDRILRFKNGSFFQFMSYEQDLQKLGSATLHRVHYDEEPPKKVFEECQPRLMRYGGDQIFTMTPLQGMSWTYTDIWQLSGATDERDKSVFFNQKDKVASVIVDMDDNPYLTTEAKEDTLRGFDAPTRKARKEGRFVHFAGLIYNEFKENEHISYNHPERPMVQIGENGEIRKKDYHVIVGIDPGLITCAVLWAAVDEDNNMVVFDELYVENWNIQEVCEAIKKINSFHYVKPIYNIIDPHARDRSKQTGKSDQSVFTKHGIYTILGQNAVEAGINEVKERLKDHKLIIHDTCKHLIQEFRLYRWKEPSKRIEQDQKAEPIKKNDHALDALRYIVMSRPYLPRIQESDQRTEQQKLMDEDKERTESKTPRHEFGGGVYV